jgi:ketosteroid isomerase-like protein
MVRRLLLSIAFLLAIVSASGAEEIHLLTCDGLPVVPVSVARMKFLFLLDTAATSILNLKSFPYGNQQNVSVTSWTGTDQIKGQRVTIGDLVVGEHHLRNLTLSAVDLSAIGHACGRQVDGIMGADVLRTLGAVVDLKARVAELPGDAESAQARVAELDERLARCAQAFNRGGEELFSECLDPAVVLFTEFGDFYGREAVMKYYREKFRDQRLPMELIITPRAHHLLGDAIWVEYEIRATLGGQTMISRGTALCQKTDGRWQIVHLNSSSPPNDGLALADH